jgi:SAM-dependent methyltransferase
MRRLNWGCGEWAQPGWINSDLKEGPGVIAADIRAGLPFESASMDYVVSIHALPELAYPELVPALAELRRVLKPRGVLRLGLPDLVKGIEACRRGDVGYFDVPDEEMRSLGGKLAVQLIWYGYSRSVFVGEFVVELLEKAGFREICEVGYRETASGFAEIVELDNRPHESLFMEAVR